METTRVIAVRKPPYSITEHILQPGEDVRTVEAGFRRQDHTTVILTEYDRPQRMEFSKPKERHLIKRWDPTERRMYFWVTPWARKAEDNVIHQTGGWTTRPQYATIYGDPTEAERVNLLRRLEGTVDVARAKV